MSDQWYQQQQTPPMDEQRQWQDQAAQEPDRAQEHAAAVERIKGVYAELEQKGLDPANRPGMTPRDERDPHKTVPDLEDLTGNPGHRGINPNAPVDRMYPDLGREGGVEPTPNVLPSDQATTGELQYISAQDVRAGRPIPDGWVLDTTRQYYVSPDYVPPGA